jgi:tetratricopeptide (TPR) repeat protein
MNPPANNSTAPSLKEIYARQVEAAKQKSIQISAARLEELQAAIHKNSSDTETYIELACCLRQLNREEEAIDVAEEGLSQCPNSERLHETRISLLEGCNRTREAIAAARKAMHIFPQNLWMKLTEALLLPVVYSSNREMEDYRERWRRFSRSGAM